MEYFSFWPFLRLSGCVCRREQFISRLPTNPKTLSSAQETEYTLSSTQEIVFKHNKRQAGFQCPICA